MQWITVLQLSDTHGRVAGPTRGATMGARTRDANPDVPVIFFDMGDLEQPSQRLSNVTKGTGMHSLLGRMGCSAAVVGNGAWFRCGAHIEE